MERDQHLEKYLIKIMEKENYSYLKQYVDPKDRSMGFLEKNYFFSLSLKEIERSEKRCGFRYPNALREFYIKIGRGNLTVPHNAPEGYVSGVDNEIMNPLQIAEYMESGHYKYCWDPYSYGEKCPKGWFPFFHASNGETYFFMDSTDPEKSTVYGDSLYYSTGEKIISPSLPEFIHKLYYEDTEFYLKDK